MIAAPVTTIEPLRLLTIASQPADYVEMSDLARALAQRGHDVSLLYLYSRDDPAAGRVLEQLIALTRECGVKGTAIEVSEVPSDLPAEVVAPAMAARDPVEDSVVADALRRVIGWVRRHNLDVYPKHTIIGRATYGLAHFIDAVRDRERTRQTVRLFSQLRPRLREFPWRLRVAAVRRLYQAAAMVLHYRRFDTLVRNAIQSRRLDALLIPEDIVGSVWPVAIRAGHDLGVPTLVLPYTLANSEEAVQSLKSAAPFQTDANEVAARLYPRWRYQKGSIDILRLPSDHILAHEALGITPPDPWMMNSGFADRILVDSKASFDYFKAGGIPETQMAVVGSVSQDRMFQQRQNRDASLGVLKTELGLSGDKPLLLISGCPNQLSAPVPFCEFATMKEVARHVGESVKPLANDYHLVVRPHPNFMEFGAMLEPFGVRSTTMPTASLVPLADVFVAFASATIRWAIACGVPTLNYDVFHYGYGDFAAAHGVISVQASSEFTMKVRALTPGSAAHTELVENAKQDSAHWSVLDGGSLLRIENEIRQARTQRAPA